MKYEITLYDPAGFRVGAGTIEADSPDTAIHRGWREINVVQLPSYAIGERKDV